jgi:CcmD family protein
MDKLKRIAAIVILAIIGVTVHAQTSAPDAAASNDVMRSNGKIYVVVAIVVVILLGLFAYVWNLDKKISRLEKKN